jgi:hypothetical protein
MGFGRLEEQITDWQCEARVDRGARVLRNVALTGRESKNGYRYSESALRNAARLYDHKPVFLDHADRPGGTANRSTRDLVGSIINSRFEDGRVRSDVRVLDTESGRTFLALAEENTPGVGMSHVVLAHRSVDGATVERIDDVLSVDVVVKPATTTTIRESDRNGTASDSTDADQDAVQTASSEAITASREASVADRLDWLVEQISDLRRVCHSLRSTENPPSDPATATAQDEAGPCREAAPSPVEGHTRDSPPAGEIDELLREARLPLFAVTDVFRESLWRAADESSRRRLIADRRELLEQAGRSRVLSTERSDGAPSHGRATFVAAVRGR